MLTQNQINVVIKAIGTVESNFRYDAINYNDPITVGVAQWFGNRAYDILNQMRTVDPDHWAAVAASLRTQVESNSVDWTKRYISKTEGESLRALLLANKSVQNAQFSKDILAYVDKAKSWGLDVGKAPEAVMMFCTTYHQAPARTLEVVRSLGTNAPTLQQYYNAVMANAVLSKYATRQRTVFNIISNNDSSGVDFSGDTPQPSPLPSGWDDIDEAKGEDSRDNALNYLEVAGNIIIAHMRDGAKIKCYPATVGRFLAESNTVGSVTGGNGDPAPGGNETPADPTPTPEPSGKYHNPTDNMRLTNPFGVGGYSATAFHTGIDLGAKRAGVAGDPIYAIADGTIVRVGGHENVLWGHSGYGVLLQFTFEGVTYYAFYGHLNSYDVRQGQHVKAGDQIATMGGTGRNHSNTDFAVHLHFSIVKNVTINPSGATVAQRSNFVDPAEVLDRMGL